MPALLAERVVLATRRRGREAAVLMFSALVVTLWALRARWVGVGFPYMLGNLFLAWIPWLLGLFAARARSRVTLLVLLPPWLLFLPNAPYLVTDLLHFHPRPPVPLWFDGLLHGSLAVAGCALGWTSLSMVGERLARELGALRAELLVMAVAALTGFGVYLGRFGRWNSWDLWTRPSQLIDGATDALSLRALAFSAFFGLFVWAGHLMVAPEPASRTAPAWPGTAGWPDDTRQGSEPGRRPG